MRKSLILAIIAVALIFASFNFGKQQVPIIPPLTEEDSYFIGVFDGCYNLLGWLTVELSLGFTEISGEKLCMGVVAFAEERGWYELHQPGSDY